jgi:hypothetical protein
LGIAHPTRAGALALTAFAAAQPAEYQWLVTGQAAGNTFAMSLLSGIARYGNLTPRQLAAVQRNLPAAPLAIDSATLAAAPLAIDSATLAAAQVHETDTAIGRTPEGEPVTQAQVLAGTPVLLSSLVPTWNRAPDPAPAPVTIDAGPLRAALDAAAASGLRKVRLDLGPVTFKRTGPTFRAGGEGHILCYHAGTYCGRIDRANVWHRAVGDPAGPDAMAAFTLAAADPEAAARAHGADTTRCSCCRRTLTDPVSVMQGIGPVCIERFGWRLR